MKINNAKPCTPCIYWVFGFSVIILYGHSCATMLLAKKVPLEKIKEWLGHADIKMTERYAHMNVSVAKDEMADIMSAMIALE